MILYFQALQSPIGELHLVTSDSAVKAIVFEGGWKSYVEASHVTLQKTSTPLILQTRQQLEEYFKGQRSRFDLPLEPEGTVFQEKAWKALLTIPYGETISYGEQARRLGQPKAARAVGGANNKNPIPIIIPCHRVIGKNGSMVGFGGGLPTKEKLLRLEQKTLSRPSTRSQNLSF